MRRRSEIILIALALLGIIVLGYRVYAWQQAEELEPQVVEPAVPEEKPVTEKRVSVLLIGSDYRPGDTEYNTDTIILASADLENKRISVLSIPRDTRVYLPEHGYVKINSVAALAGLPALKQVVADLTGVEIAGYAETNFAGFKDIIDTLGGITIDVEKNMYYETGDKEDGVINLRKGVQRLNGEQALQYARFRHDTWGDISRTARQQKVLKAAADEALQLSTVTKLPTLIPQIMDSVQTDLSVGDIWRFSKVVVTFDSSNMVTQTLPGQFLDLDGVSYWEVDPDEAKEVVNNLFQGLTTDKVINHEEVDLLKPVIVNPNKPLPQVPGNSTDPNGQASPGHEEEQAGN